MKAILIAGSAIGLAMILPALAQTPGDRAVGLVQVLGGTVVKNAPYSADAVTETTQVLGDGNRISQRTTQKLYRDSDGRERREESVLAAGALAQANAPRVITISDPVQNVSYSLDPQQRVARRTPGLAGGVFFRTQVGTAVSVVDGYNGTLGIYNGGLRTARINGPPSGSGAREDLGSRNMEGVIAQGSRTTETIPAGQIGNQLPIKVIDEVWYSNELQMNVMTTHSDPRSGETVYKLTNINRGNQPRTLFEPPADYTVTGPEPGVQGGLGPGVNPPPAGGGRGGRGGGRGGARGGAPPQN